MIDGICILVSKTFFIYQILFASFISNTTVVICGAGTSGGFRGGVRGVRPPKIRKATLIKQFNK